MNIYDAIMAAADHIERHPEHFDFMAKKVPGDCGTPGCALGWISFFSGAGRASFWDAHEIMGLEWSDDVFARIRHRLGEFQFYDRMDSIDGEWRDSADHCAAALRAYARQYHAPRTLDWESLAAPGAGTREEVST